MPGQAHSLHALVENVLADVDAVTADGVAGITREVPAYQTEALVSQAELFSQLRANITGILLAFAGEDPDARSLVATAAATGRTRADQGIELDALLWAYRLGAQAIWRQLLTRAADGPQSVRDELLQQAIRLWTIIDQASSAVADAYRSRDSELSRSAELRRDVLMDALLAGRGGERPIAAAAAEELGLPPAARFLVVWVLRGRDIDGPRGTELAQALDAFRIHSVWRSGVDRDVGVVRLADADVRRVTKILTGRVDGPVGCSVVTGLDQLAWSVTEAELTARSLPPGEPAVALSEDRLPEVLVLSAPRIADRLEQRFLGRVLELPPDEQDVLLATLDCWLRNGRSATVTAQQLHCHRNTIFNRIRRIEELTGGIADSHGSIGLHLALLRNRMARTAPS